MKDKETSMQILQEIDRLEQETTISLCVRDPAKYKSNTKKIALLQSVLRKRHWWK